MKRKARIPNASTLACVFFLVTLLVVSTNIGGGSRLSGQDALKVSREITYGDRVLEQLLVDRPDMKGMDEAVGAKISEWILLSLNVGDNRRQRIYIDGLKQRDSEHFPSFVIGDVSPIPFVIAPSDSKHHSCQDKWLLLVLDFDRHQISAQINSILSRFLLREITATEFVNESAKIDFAAMQVSKQRIDEDLFFRNGEFASKSVLAQLRGLPRTFPEYEKRRVKGEFESLDRRVFFERIGKVLSSPPAPEKPEIASEKNADPSYGQRMFAQLVSDHPNLMTSEKTGFDISSLIPKMLNGSNGSGRIFIDNREPRNGYSCEHFSGNVGAEMATIAISAKNRYAVADQWLLLVIEIERIYRSAIWEKLAKQVALKQISRIDFIDSALENDYECIRNAQRRILETPSVETEVLTRGQIGSQVIQFPSNYSEFIRAINLQAISPELDKRSYFAAYFDAVQQLGVVVKDSL